MDVCISFCIYIDMDNLWDILYFRDDYDADDQIENNDIDDDDNDTNPYDYVLRREPFSLLIPKRSPQSRMITPC